jgi:hypothetical protein
MKVKLEGRNLDDILNVEQTPIMLLYHSNKMLDLNGSKTVQFGASTMDMKHVMLAATVTESGKILTPFVIFNCKPNGHIALRELGLTLMRENMHARRRPGWKTPR